MGSFIGDLIKLMHSEVAYKLKFCLPTASGRLMYIVYIVKDNRKPNLGYAEYLINKDRNKNRKDDK